MKDLQKNVLILMFIAAISVAILAVIKGLTHKDYIKTMEIEENKIRKIIFPDAESFRKIDINGIEAFIAVKNNKDIGIVTRGVNNRGFGGIIEVAVGVNLTDVAKSTIKGFEILKHNETPGLGTKATEARFKNPFNGKTIATLPEGSSDFKARLGIDTITGATITSVAVLNAVRDGLNKALKYISKAENKPREAGSVPVR
jgi:electron transport complex protein RnfG